MANRPNGSRQLAVIAVFSSLIAMGTFFSIKLPPPLGEITWAPPIYLALALLTPIRVSASAVGIGSVIGETLNVALLGWPPIYIPGLFWARVPVAIIVGKARKKGRGVIVLSMVAATLFETAAFFFPDWAFFTYGLFGYGDPTTALLGFSLALPDLLTMLDLLFIPIGLLLAEAARSPFSRIGFE